MSTRKIVGAVVLGVLLLSLGVAQAQDRPELPSAISFSGIPFNFAPPGARSLGMGAAFIGIADDATAAEANPAGLTILTRPEASAHFRFSSYNIDFYNPTAYDVQSAYDQGNGIGTYDQSVSTPSFFSFVKPFRGVVLSIYYQQAADFKGTATFGAFDSFFTDQYTVTENVKFQLEHIGVSLAFRLGDRVALGFSARNSRLSLRSLDELRVDYWRDLPDEPNVTDYFGLATRFDDHDSTLTYNVGLLINPNGKLSMGVVYKKGGKYNLNGIFEGFDVCEGAGCYPNPFFLPGQVAVRTTFRVPDVIGVGFALRPSDQLTFAADAVQISYSDLRFEGQTEKLDNAVEAHFGFEYTFFPGGGEVPFSIRAGVFTDPDHDGYAQIKSDDTHYTIGAGVVTKGNFQIDLAYSFSDRVDEGILSFVYRF